MPLQAPRNERHRPPGRRPLASREAGDPELVELDSGRLQRPEHLDRGPLNLRLEDRIGGHRAQLPDCLPECDPGHYEIQPRKIVQQVAPPVDELKVRTLGRRGTRPPEYFQQLVNEPCPVRR